MSKLSFNKLSIVGLAIGAMLCTPMSSIAQVPMYQIFGVNPHQTPNVAPLQHFSPLQAGYSTPGRAQAPQTNCVPCVVIQPTPQPYSIGRSFQTTPELTFSADPTPAPVLVPDGLSVVSKDAPPSAVNEIPGEITTSVVSPKVAQPTSAKPTVLPPKSVPKPALVAPGSLASPSDVKKTRVEKEPTLADEATSEIVAQLDDARKLITTLKDELTETRQKARAAADRAYVAEKAAAAAKASAAKSLAKLKASANKGNKTSQPSKKQLTLRQVQLEEMKKELEVRNREMSLVKDSFAQKEQALLVKLELAIKNTEAMKRQMESQRLKLQKSKNQLAELEKSKVSKVKKPNLQRQKNDAQKRLDRLIADAKVNAKSAKKGDDKSAAKKPRGSAGEQIKKLRESMERQIKRSNDQIRKRSESKMDQLIQSGKAKDSEEVKRVVDEMKAQMKANEEKVRNRVDERIKRIQKEAAAREKS